MPEGDRKPCLNHSCFALSASNTSARGTDETDVFILVSSLNTDLKDKVEHKTIAKQVRRVQKWKDLQPGSASSYKTHPNKPQQWLSICSVELVGWLAM